MSQAGEFEQIQFPEGFITELVCARYGTLDMHFKDGSELTWSAAVANSEQSNKTVDSRTGLMSPIRLAKIFCKASSGSNVGRTGTDAFRALSRQGGAGDQ